MKRFSLLASAALVLAAGVALAQADKPHGPGMMMQADANKDGNITAQEAQTMRAAHFEKMDANKDGFVDKDEMQKARQEHHKGRHGEHGMMKGADADKDGKISKTEFIAGAETRFAKMDSNKDGFLDQSDRKDGMGKGHMKDGKGSMAELDSNKDGKLSRAEFLSKNSMFERVDANKDGVLDKSELASIPGHGPAVSPPAP